MLAPDSVGLLIVLGAVAVGAMVLALRGGPLVLRLVAGLLALAVVFVAGAATVNVYFGYFTTWGDITSGLGGTPAAPSVRSGPAGLSAAAVRRTLATLPVSASGTLLAVPLPGSRSRIDGRSGYVWLPPQYREAAYAHSRFPVVELIPGTPGQPSDWVRNIHVTTMLAALTATRHIGPMVVIMAPSNPPVGTGNGEECTNKPIKGPQDATYMARDVPADVAAAFRVYPPGPRWAVGGFSSGGYCAAKLAVGYPRTFGAVADLDGYLSPLEDGGLWHVIFYRNFPAIRANDVSIMINRNPGLRLPPFYLVAGTGNREDIDDLVTLRTLLHGRLPATAVTTVVDASGHTFRAWRAQLPATLVWIWHRIGKPPAAPKRPAPPRPELRRHGAVSVVVHPAR